MTQEDKNFDPSENNELTPKERERNRKREIYMKTPVQSLLLPLSTENGLIRSKFYTVRDIAQCSQNELRRKVKHMRLRDLRNVVLALARLEIWLPELSPEECKELDPQDLENAIERYSKALPPKEEE